VKVGDSCVYRLNFAEILARREAPGAGGRELLSRRKGPADTVASDAPWGCVCVKASPAISTFDCRESSAGAVR
jgi:hypothetical protein